MWCLSGGLLVCYSLHSLNTQPNKLFTMFPCGSFLPACILYFKDGAQMKGSNNFHFRYYNITISECRLYTSLHTVYYRMIADCSISGTYKTAER